MTKNFISKHGFILPNSKQEQSENGVKISVEDFFLQDDLDFPLKSSSLELSKLIKSLHETNDGDYRTLPNDDNPRFSIDNIMAVAGFSRFCLRRGLIPNYSKENLDKVNLIDKESPAYLRPDVFSFLLLCKYPIANILILPRLIVAASMLLTSLKPVEGEKNFLGMRPGTSGKLLAYSRYKSLNMKWTWWLCTQFMNIRLSFNIYYPEYDHPCNKKARRVWP